MTATELLTLVKKAQTAVMDLEEALASERLAGTGWIRQPTRLYSRDLDDFEHDIMNDPDTIFQDD